MTNQYSKEFVSLLASIVTEVCDDSEEEDLLPLKAAQEYLNTLSDKRKQNEEAEKEMEAREAEAKEKENKELEPVEQVAIEHSYFIIEKTEDDLKTLKVTKPVSPYVTLSLFENKSAADVQFTIRKGSLCDKTLKIASFCLCSSHRKPQIHGYAFYLPPSVLTPDFVAQWKMKLSTIEEIYNLVHNISPLGEKVTSAGFLAVILSLTTEETTQDIVSRFGMSEEDLASQQRYVMDSLLTKKSQFECWPSGSLVTKTKAGFLGLGGLPDLIGCVACVHFQCKVEEFVDPDTFRNINGETTVVFLLVCNHQGSFIYSSYFWWPGHFSEKDLYEESNLKGYPIPPSTYLAGSRCFAPISGVLTPYYEPTDSRALVFNARHGKAYEVMSKSISQLASRFSSLRVVETKNAWNLRKKFNCCVLLHNICIEMKDDIEYDGFLPLGAYFPPPPIPNAPDAEHDLREIIGSSL